MKRIIFIILFLFLVFNFQAVLGAVLSAPAETGSEDEILLDQIKAKEEEIKKLEAEEAKYRQSLEATQENAKTLKSQITLIEIQIKKLNNDLKIAKARIAKTESNIKLHSVQIKFKAGEIESRQASIADAMRILARSDDQGLLAKMLMNSKLSDFLSDSQYIVGLQNGLYNNLKILTKDKADLEGLVSEEKDLKSNLITLKNDLTIKNQLVANQKQEKNQLLTATKNQEQEYQKMISKAQIKQTEIQNEISALESKLRGEVSGLPKAEPSILSWPLIGRITQGYGSTSITGFYNRSYTFHNGIDLAAYYGAAITAALDGEVVASGDNGVYAYGRWLAIRHNNGLTTLYSHLAAKTVKIGQSVKKGDTVGYEGSSGFVTGPHLHFTVYSSNTFKTVSRWYGLLPLGGSVNPFDYLLKKI